MNQACRGLRGQGRGGGGSGCLPSHLPSSSVVDRGRSVRDIVTGAG